MLWRAKSQHLILYVKPKGNLGGRRYLADTSHGQLRNVLKIPVPTVLEWSSPTEQVNPVGAEYILMERVDGRQLSEVWDALSETQRFGLVKSLVNIEQKLLSAEFAFHGSLY